MGPRLSAVSSPLGSGIFSFIGRKSAAAGRLDEVSSASNLNSNAPLNQLEGKCAGESAAAAAGRARRRASWERERDEQKEGEQASDDSGRQAT